MTGCCADPESAQSPTTTGTESDCCGPSTPDDDTNTTGSESGSCCCGPSTPDDDDTTTTTTETESGSCCAPVGGADPQPCPRCGTTGPVVGERPVRPHRPTAAEGPWRFCPETTCGVVYHLDGNVLETAELRTQVDHKALDKPTPVCFCFSHTRDDLVDDLRRHGGESTIQASIKEAVAGGFCACEHLNPSGRCCLADVHRTIKAIRAEESQSA